MKLDTAKGVRDFPPEEKILRDKIVATIKETFELYGFNPIETPIIERYEVLTAKFAAGEESDALKETFKLTDQGERKLGLRFDLTVPFCRYVGMNPKMKMPFKKYMSGQVFRDGPIKTGRYRQFMQMDPDIVGTDSMLADSEIISLSETVFNKLGFEVNIKLNNRKILDGIMGQLDIDKENRFPVMVSIDKLDKIGKQGVSEELSEKGLDNEKINYILNVFEQEASNQETINKLKSEVNNNVAQEGLSEIQEIINYLDIYGVKSVKFDPSLARGLAYYTGPVFEIYLKNSKITSSVAGGGRYDKIIGNYLQSKKSYPATGISYGIDVILEALKEKNMPIKKSVAQVYVIPIKVKKQALEIVQTLRKAGIKTDFDLMDRGLSSNLDYANKLGIPYVIIVGQRDLDNKQVTLRNMKSGKEEKIDLNDISKIKV
ncbi:MAG: Histidine--tRNA ligase [Candidatus Woesearchaeota archaeon]|nr:Histidine--tRNA ligase [Candidatus Woesearchaeota archaeon]